MQIHGQYPTRRPSEPATPCFRARSFRKVEETRAAVAQLQNVMELVPGSERAEKARDTLREPGA